MLGELLVGSIQPIALWPIQPNFFRGITKSAELFGIPNKEAATRVLVSSHCLADRITLYDTHILQQFIIKVSDGYHCLIT